MFPQIKIGLSFFIEKLVTQQDSAKYYGSGLVEVFASPAMIAFMEKAALECVNHLLPEGFTTVGAEIKVKHIKATAVGKKVKCKATVIKIDNKKITFEITAEDEDAQIGFGTHTRFIINQAEFMEKLD